MACGAEHLRPHFPSLRRHDPDQVHGLQDYLPLSPLVGRPGELARLYAPVPWRQALDFIGFGVDHGRES